MRQLRRLLIPWLRRHNLNLPSGLRALAADLRGDRRAYGAQGGCWRNAL